MCTVNFDDIYFLKKKSFFIFRVKAETTEMTRRNMKTQGL